MKQYIINLIIECHSVIFCQMANKMLILIIQITFSAFYSAIKITSDIFCSWYPVHSFF
jgi:hypothetical protein